MPKEQLIGFGLMGIMALSSIISIVLLILRVRKDKEWQAESERTAGEMEKLRAETHNTLAALHKQITDLIQTQVKAISDSEKQLVDRLEGELKRFVGVAELHVSELEKVMDVNLKEIKAEEAKDLQEIRVTIDTRLKEGVDKIMGESNKIMQERMTLSNHAVDAGQVYEALSRVYSELQGTMQSVEMASRKCQNVSNSLARYQVTPTVQTVTAPVLPFHKKAA